MTQTVLTDIDGAVATVTMNRPEARNALNSRMQIDLTEALRKVGADASIRCVILTGSGGCFSAGDDLNETAAIDELGFAEHIERFQSMTRILRGIPQPVIAAIEGYAVGGGVEIAAACDIRIAAEGTIFFCPEVRFGMIMTNGAASLLPRIIGAGRAREMALTAGRYDASWAERVGLVSRVVPAERLLAEALSIAQTIAANNSTSVRLTKALLNAVEAEEVAVAMNEETKTILAAFREPGIGEEITDYFKRRRRQN